VGETFCESRGLDVENFLAAFRHSAGSAGTNGCGDMHAQIERRTAGQTGCGGRRSQHASGPTKVSWRRRSACSIARSTSAGSTGAKPLRLREQPAVFIHEIVSGKHESVVDPLRPRPHTHSSNQAR
jgi:hypothetical protein